MGTRRVSPPTPWATQVKAQIRKRYSRLAGENGFPPGGADRVLAAGYPEGEIAALPAGLAEGYSGCGYLLDGVKQSGVRTAVDLGCGAGLDARLLADQLAPDAIVIALDFTEAMLRRVDTIKDDSAARILPVAGDMEQLPLANGSADLVTANAAFNLTLDKVLAFSEAARILRPGGRLVARDLIKDREIPQEVLQDPLSSSTSLGGVVTEPELRGAIAAAGFEGIQISGHQPFSYVTSVKIEALKR